MLVEETLEAPARTEELAALHAVLDRFWAAVEQALPQPPPEQWRLGFATAIAEIAANIMRHAYPERAAPGALSLRLQAYSDRMEATFTDWGIPFAPPAAGETPPAGRETLAEGGYGLALVRATVDRLDYDRSPAGENHWRLVKHL